MKGPKPIPLERGEQLNLVGCGSTTKGKMKTDFSVVGNYANISQQGEYALGDHAIAYAKSTSAQQTLYL